LAEAMNQAREKAAKNQTEASDDEDIA